MDETVVKVSRRDPVVLGLIVLETARRCKTDRDPTPYCLVVTRSEMTRAANLFHAAVEGADWGVTVELNVDQGSRELAVLTFAKAEIKA